MFACLEVVITSEGGRGGDRPCTSRSSTFALTTRCSASLSDSHHAPNSSVYSTSHTMLLRVYHRSYIPYMEYMSSHLERESEQALRKEERRGQRGSCLR